MAGGDANGLSKLTCRVPFPVSPRATLTLVAKTRDSESLIAIVDGGHSSRRDSRKAKDRFAVGITELEECTLVGHSEIDVVAVGQPYAGQRII